jgi:hypothetical protein
MDLIRVRKHQLLFIALGFFFSCSNNQKKVNDEQIIANVELESSGDSLANTIQGNATMKQIHTYPNHVILTGLAKHRLVSIYKSKLTKNEEPLINITKYRSSIEYGESEYIEHYMPGIDILYGYNLLNIAHYDLETEIGSFLFNHPVLIKTLYYPSYVQDSINKIPVNRDYYLVSVYDEDSNHDSLINKKDLRRLYYFDASAKQKKKLINNDYSVIKSEYDMKNDAMYIFAALDENKNGMNESKEPIHIFWFSLKTPDVAKRLY